MASSPKLRPLDCPCSSLPSPADALTGSSAVSPSTARTCRECGQHSPRVTISFDYTMASHCEVCAAQITEVCGSHLGIPCSLHMIDGLRLERNRRLGWRSVDEEDVARTPPDGDGPGTSKDQCKGACDGRSWRTLKSGASNAGWHRTRFKHACMNMHLDLQMQT